MSLLYGSLLQGVEPLLPKIQEDKTVFLAILARDKGHCLPVYLQCIENLEYDKGLISVYINTNNNQDDTKEILEDWVSKNEGRYRSIIYENHQIENFHKINPHEWSPKMFKILGTIRNKSMDLALEQECDYYFIVDCDNFITPCTLKYLMEKNKPIIAPMLLAITSHANSESNFHHAITGKGWPKASNQETLIKFRRMLGTFKVPIVHCTYLVKSEYLPKLGYIDGTKDFEYLIFSRMARKNKVEQFICNEMDFGTLVSPAQGKRTLQNEKKILDEFFKISPLGQQIEFDFVR